MSNKQLKNFARQVANLDATDQLRVLNASDDDLPEILKSMGIQLPSSSWILRILKILLYGLGVVLAGIGTTASAAVIF